MSIALEQTRIGSWQSVIMQNDAMRVTVIPEIGGKIISLQSLRTGREWLWKNPYLPLNKPPADARDFGAYDCGGWDEVFPTVNACQVSNSAWGDRTLTDHGELWFRPWRIADANTYSQTGAVLTLAVDDPQLPFQWERTLTLAAGSAPLVASYSVTNKSTMPMPFIWAAHPLLAIEPGDSFQIPEGTRISSTGYRGLELAESVTEFAWPRLPLAFGEWLDISRAPEPSAGFAIKLFAHNVRDRTIEIANRERNEVFRLSVDANHPAHFGLWLNFGAWSGANTQPYFNVGIEPTNFPHDDLNAAADDQTAQLAAGATRQWVVTVSIREPNGTM